MYFKSRAEAGRQLADKLEHYANKQTVVIALSNGSLLVGAQIAMRIHANLMLLLHEPITLPGESEPLATLTSTTFTYNKAFSSGEVEDLVGEYRGIIEEQRIAKMHHLNRLLSDGGEIDPKFLKRHVVIIVADGLPLAAPLDVVADFLKPIKIPRLLIATPLASVNAVDRMHLLGDEVYCLNTAENLMELNHYYEDNTLPEFDDCIKIMQHISMTWTSGK